MIHIVTDSTSDLTKEEIEKYNIHVVPLTIYAMGKTYIDGVDIKPESFLELLQEMKELPKSSQPSIGVFKEIYDRLAKDGDEVISIHVSGNLSGTVETARQAANMSETKVNIIDSKFIALALAIQVREAVRLRDQGATSTKIIERLEEVRRNTRMLIFLDTLTNLLKGGRIGKGKAFIGSLLNIKPIAILENGEYSPVAKVRSYKQVIKFIYNEFLKDIKDKTVKYVGIAHADGMKNVGNPLKELVEASGYKNIEIKVTSPVISTHTGPGALALIYFAE